MTHNLNQISILSADSAEKRAKGAKNAKNRFKEILEFVKSPKIEGIRRMCLRRLTRIIFIFQGKTKICDFDLK